MATVCACGIATIELISGDAILVTCGSITIDVHIGPVGVTFGLFRAVLLPDTAATIAEPTPGAFEVTNSAESAAPITVNGVQIPPDRSGQSRWNHVCYTDLGQPLEAALAAFIEDVAAAYRLRPDQGYDRWFPGRPDVSTITSISPYESLFLLMSNSTAWAQQPSTPPTGTNLQQGWNSTCYAGDSKSVGDAAATIASQLGILYALRSDQTWSRHVPDRPEMSSIARLKQYDALLILVTDPGGTTWAFDPWRF